MSFQMTGANRQQATAVRKSYEGGEGTAAWTLAKADCNAASIVWTREVFSPVPPLSLSPSSTLSAVTGKSSVTGKFQRTLSVGQISTAQILLI
jgi:hypothetical protein